MKLNIKCLIPGKLLLRDRHFSVAIHLAVNYVLFCFVKK